MGLYRALKKVPIISTVLGILNAYAYRGDYSAGQEFAGIYAFVKILWRPFLISLLCTLGILSPWVHTYWSSGVTDFSLCLLGDFASKPGALSVGVIPSLLGFGIGVYALTFAIPEALVQMMDKRMAEGVEAGDRKYGSVLVLNADLGYPLVVLTISLAIGVFQQAYPTNAVFLFVCWFAFWYSVISMIEIIGVLFQLADLAILGKREKGVKEDFKDCG